MRDISSFAMLGIAQNQRRFANLIADYIHLTEALKEILSKTAVVKTWPVHIFRPEPEKTSIGPY